MIKFMQKKKEKQLRAVLEKYSKQTDKRTHGQTDKAIS